MKQPADYTNFEECHLELPMVFHVSKQIIDKLIQNEGLSNTFTYLDVFICGHTQTEHDENLDKFITATEMEFNILMGVFSPLDR